MTKVRATNTRKIFLCSSKDKIMDNGSCYQLITQSFHKDYNTYTKLYNVIAWKEIVLPKEIKENETVFN